METKRKRGRPKKVQLPEEIQNLVNEVQNKAEQQTEIKTVIAEPKKPEEFKWDVKIGDPIEFFDANLSYEITGYRPINKTYGLDFNPEWFTEAREVFKRTGHYTQYKYTSKGGRDFWNEQYRRCKNGYTVNGYTITGDNYFFLNFYTLPVIDQKLKSGSGTHDDFPIFFVSQYIFFHYLEIAKQCHLHAALMKARSIGFSEINASLATNMYSIVPNSITMITCFDAEKLKRTYRKFTHALQFLDTKTDGGMFKLRQLEDQALSKKSGHFINIQGQKVPAGFQSQVIGINGSDPSNIRGDRVELLIYDEAGSWPGLTTAVVQGQELVEVGGVPRGTMIFGGTGGDKGKNLEGLRTIYYNPKAFKVLPYRHSYTQTGDTVLTGFFIPYFSQLMVEGFTDSRGYCDEEKAKEYLQKERDHLAAIPQEYLKKCAERCWNAEEAFNLEGENKFNKIHITEQLTRIRALKQCPKIESGYLEYTYKTSEHNPLNINGFRWIENNASPLKILEHPIWELPPKKDEKGNLLPVPEKMKGLYVIGIDGIDIGANQTSSQTKDPSDFCLVVMRRAYGISGPQIVATYKDRPPELKEAYKIAIKLAQYYNATINIEATRMSFVTWARDRQYLSYFMKRPRATLQDIQRGVSKQYGTPATAAIIAHQTDLIADFINDYYDGLWFEDILEQLNQYSDENKRKFDYVAALGMVMLADEELSGITPKSEKPQIEVWEDIGYYIDSNGIKRYGIIPKANNQKILFNNDWQEYENGGLRTFDSRDFQEYI